MLDTPRNEWRMVRQRQVEEIQAVRDGKMFDIVDRRSWPFPYLPECLSQDSQILTKDGFKGKDEISKCDLVATLNLETNELEYFHPKRIIKRQYSGPMLLFKGRGFDHLVTPNHDMVGRWFWKNYDRGGKKKPYLQSGNIDRVVDYVEGNRAYSAFSRATAQKILESGWHGGDYGFQVPFGAKWKGVLPKFCNKRTGKITLHCKYGWEPHRWTNSAKNSYFPVEIDLKDYMRLLGLFISEGSCVGNEVKKKKHLPRYVQVIAAAADNAAYNREYGYNISIFQVKTSKHFRKMDKLLTRLPFGFERDEGQNSWHCSNRTLHGWVFECGDSTYTKHIPQWVKDLPSEYLKILIRWYTKGDGTIAKNSGNARWCYTTSPKLAEDLQEVFLKIGTQAKVTKTDSTAAQYFGGSTPERCAPKYTIEENLGRFRALPRPKEVSYTGCVWCVDIPPNATIFVRRGGKGVWTGNSLHRLNQPV